MIIFIQKSALQNTSPCLKTLVINILIALTIAISVYLVQAYHSDSEFDKMEVALKDAQVILKRSRISLTAPGINDEAKIALTYALAPTVVYNDREMDTSIHLLNAHVSDSEKNVLLKNCNIIWQNRDDEYQYVISKRAGK
jgi:hypothetical protein